jgi:hypothetical protein
MIVSIGRFAQLRGASFYFWRLWCPFFGDGKQADRGLNSIDAVPAAKTQAGRVCDMHGKAGS